MPHHEPLYTAFRGFLDNCWLEDRSLLWPDRSVWTITTLEAMRRRFVEVFIEGHLTFREKLEAQLDGAPPEVWALAADCFYVYGLGSSSILFRTKVDLVSWCAGHAGLPLPPENDPLWDALKLGVAATGQKYNFKHAQLRLLILAGLEIKASNDRSTLLASPDALQSLLDGILDSIPVRLDRANDMRNAVLYLAFPEHYEPILSNRDKDAILAYYQNQVRKKLPLDRDAALRQVRHAIEPRFAGSDRPFEFFGELRGEWRPSLHLERLLSRQIEPDIEDTASQKPAQPLAVREVPAPYHSNETADPDLQRVITALRRTPNVILSGPPGVGKTYLAGRAAELLTGSQPGGFDPYVRWVTFHPSYSYEDFIEGMRPTVGAEGQLVYEVRPGIFRDLCDSARRDPDHRYILVIDEINRGNLASILGEMVTLLEEDKRGQLSVTLPYSGQRFSVPPNLAVLGTMNTADRSIALLDAALRRRFSFIEIYPRPDLLSGVVVETEEASVHLDALLARLNAALARTLDRTHQIGHSYLLPVARAAPTDRLEALEFAWNHQILPLLEEYFAARPDQLVEILSPLIEEGEEWGQVSRLTGEDLVVALSRLGL